MKLGDFRTKTKDLGDSVLISIAEVDEMAAIHVKTVDIIDDASVQANEADGKEAIDLDGGKRKAIVLRY